MAAEDDQAFVEWWSSDKAARIREDLETSLHQMQMDDVRLVVQHAYDAGRARGSGSVPEWVVNDIGELGVQVGERVFFLYKGRSLEYEWEPDIDGDGLGPMMYRPVYKREFGEVAHPFDWWDETGERRYPGRRYRVGDGWRPVPPAERDDL